MEIVNAVVLAVVEGITEFLPVSSTGHLIVFERWFPLADSSFTQNFQIIIQLPAILAVVVYFWSAIWPFGKAPEERRDVFQLWMLVAVAFIPAAVLGLLLDDLIGKYLFNTTVVGIALIVGGVILIIVERRGFGAGMEDVRDVGYRRALGIGFFQCLAMIPGTSRSAATIIGAMLLGANRRVAAEFSFFLAIPTMLGATTLTLVKAELNYSREEWIILGIGSAVSFLTALAVIAVFMQYIRRNSFIPFGIYRIVAGAAILAYFAWAN